MGEWTREEHESVKREVERGGHLDHEEALRALAEIERLNGRLAHAHDAANKLYRAASLFTSGWDDIAIRQVFGHEGGEVRDQFEALRAALDLSEQEACAQEAARRDGLEEENARLRREVGVHKGEAATLRARLAQTTEAPPAEPRDESIDALRGQYLSHLAAIRRDLDAVVNRMCVPSLDADDWRAINDRISTLRETIGDVAPPATAPLAQALDLLRRVRSVLYNVGVVRSNVDAEVDALLAGTPVVEPPHVCSRVDDGSLGGHCEHEGAEPPRAPMAGYHPEIDDAIDRVLRAAETVGPSLFERSVVRLLAMLAKHRPDAAPRALLTEEEARRWSERLADRLSDLPEGQFGLAVPIIKEALSNLSRGDIPPDVRSAPASSPLGEWQCASCHARETEAHREWCQVEDKAGTIARHAPPHTHPLSPEDAARGFVPAWTDDKPSTMAAPSERPKTPGLKARLAGVTCPSCKAPLSVCTCPKDGGGGA